MDDEIDALFRLPLAEFTPARNALAARLKKAGEQEESSAVKAFTKPSVPAWVVNQLYWQHRKPFDRLIEASDRVLQAQSKQKAHNSAEMRELLEARRAAQAELVELAGEILRGAEHGDTRPMLRRVTTTLEALTTYGSRPGAPRLGRLTAELEPPGFDLLSGLVPPGDGKRADARTHERAPKPAAVKDAREDERRRAEAAKAAVREAERELRAARAQAERTAAALEAAAKRERETEARRARAEKELAKLVAEADAARERAREAEASADKAARAADNAERVLAEARSK